MAVKNKRTPSRRSTIIVGALAVVLLGALATIVIRHSGDEKILNGNGDPLVLVGKKSAAGMMALNSGVLTDIGGCLGIAPSADAVADGAIVIWPHGTTVKTPDPLRITVDGKTFKMGDKIELGGGFGPMDKSSFFYAQVPESCRSAAVFSAAPN